MTEGDIREQIRGLLADHPDMPRTEMAELLGISRKTLYKHLGRLGGDVPGSAEADRATPKTKVESGTGRRPPPGPNAGSFKPGDPRAGAPAGNDNATTTGEFRNPLIHHTPTEDVEAVMHQHDLSPVDLQRQTVQLWDARLLDMNRRLARLQTEKKQLMTVEASYVRQEGDGELVGSFRQAKRSRERVDDRIIKMHESITRVQAKRDAAVARLYDMLEGTLPEGQDDPLQALVDMLNESRKMQEAQEMRLDGEGPNLIK